MSYRFKEIANEYDIMDDEMDVKGWSVSTDQMNWVESMERKIEIPMAYCNETNQMINNDTRIDDANNERQSKRVTELTVEFLESFNIFGKDHGRGILLYQADTIIDTAYFNNTKKNINVFNRNKMLKKHTDNLELSSSDLETETFVDSKKRLYVSLRILNLIYNSISCKNNNYSFSQ